MRVLAGFVQYASSSSYLRDWLDGFVRSREIETRAVNLFQMSGPARFAAALREADVVVLLHGCLMDSLDFVVPITASLQARAVPLVAFLGNEYNNPVLPLSRRIAWLKSVGADIIVTQLGQASGDWLYEGIGRTISLPHALNPNAFQPGSDQSLRSIDIGTRSFHYPLYLGDNLRNRTLTEVEATARARGWEVVITGSRRLPRDKWGAFLRDCRLTVATEAGAPVVERSDDRAIAIDQFVSSKHRVPVYRSNSSLRFLTRRVPWPVKERTLTVLQKFGVSHEALRFDPLLVDDVFERFFSSPPNGVSGRCVSARHFDAAGSMTAQILTRGDYNGIFQAGEHYFPLETDFSNIDAVLDQASDPTEQRRVAMAAFEFAHDSHTIDHRIRQLLAELR